jgi:transcriptional regulator with XRE-family HTH domain
LEDPPSAEHTGSSLRRLRERRGMSRSAVAMVLGWNFRRLDGIEGGRRQVRFAEVIALLDLYGCGWGELTTLEDATREG